MKMIMSGCGGPPMMNLFFLLAWNIGASHDLLVVFSFFVCGLLFCFCSERTFGSSVLDANLRKPLLF